MSEDGAQKAEPLFRANKRRKVFRKRTDVQELVEGGNVIKTETESENVSPALKQEDGSEEDMLGSLQRVPRPVAKKQGVAFSSKTRNQQPLKSELEASDDNAVALVHLSREQNVVAGVDRFVKPTGRTVVEDDKHMTAFIDSKLAKMRSAIPTTNVQASSDLRGHPAHSVEEQDPEQKPGPEKVTTLRTQNRRQQQKPRRPPPARAADDVARDSLVDQIMRESTVPLYDRSASGTPFAAANTTNSIDNSIDNETAAAEAFKQQFLTDMEEQNRKRPPAPMPFSKVAQAKGAERTAHGPKLGGSRQQRERHKAAEAAKAIEQKK